MALCKYIHHHIQQEQIEYASINLIRAHYVPDMDAFDKIRVQILTSHFIPC